MVGFIQLGCVHTIEQGHSQKVKFIQQEFKEEFLQIFAQDPDPEAEMPCLPWS